MNFTTNLWAFITGGGSFDECQEAYATRQRFADKFKDEEYTICPGCGCDPEDEHEEHCEVYLEKMRERAEHMADLRDDR